MDLLNQAMAEESVIVASDEGHISDSMTEGASARTSGSYSSKRALTARVCCTSCRAYAESDLINQSKAYSVKM